MESAAPTRIEICLASANPDKHLPSMFKRYWWMLFAMMPVGMFFGLLLASVVSYVMPKKYESSATIEIKPRMSTIAPGTSGIVPQFFATEFEKIRSRDSLKKVTESLDLTGKWGLDEESVIRILKRIVVTQNLRGTDLISITVRHTNREDARDIVTEVAKTYRDYRIELETKTLEKGILELKKAVREQEARVEERRKILSTVQHATVAESTKNNLQDDESNGVAEIDRKLEEEKTQLKSQVENLQKYEGNQLLIYAAGLDVPDNIIKRLYPEFLEMRGYIDGLKAGGVADDDPSVFSKTKMLNVLKGNLEEGLANLKIRLQGQLNIANEPLVGTWMEKHESEKEAAERNVNTQDYIDAKRNFETDQALLEQMKLKVISEVMVERIPVDSIIIHDDPVIADSPVSPNVTLNLVLGALGGLLLSPFAALPFMWMMSRKKAQA